MKIRFLFLMLLLTSLAYGQVPEKWWEVDKAYGVKDKGTFIQTADNYSLKWVSFDTILSDYIYIKNDSLFVCDSVGVNCQGFKIGSDTLKIGVEEIAFGAPDSSVTSSQALKWESYVGGFYRLYVDAAGDGSGSIAIGSGSEVTDETEVAIGYRARAFLNSISFGSGAYAVENSVALGANARAGRESVAIGQNAFNTKPHQIMLGSDNDTVTVPNRLEILNTPEYQSDSVLVKMGDFVAAMHVNDLVNLQPILDSLAVHRDSIDNTDWITDVKLNGNNLEFTGIGRAFNGQVNLSGIISGYTAWELRTNGTKRKDVTDGAVVDFIDGDSIKVTYNNDKVRIDLDADFSGYENVQSDWNQSDNTKDDYIKNKPTIPTDVGDLTDNNSLLGDKNVQSDWQQSNTGADDYIKNKPTLQNLTAGDATNLNSDKVNVQVDGTTIGINGSNELEYIGSMPSGYDYWKMTADGRSENIGNQDEVKFFEGLEIELDFTGKDLTIGHRPLNPTQVVWGGQNGEHGQYWGFRYLQSYNPIMGNRKLILKDTTFATVPNDSVYIYSESFENGGAGSHRQNGIVFSSDRSRDGIHYMRARTGGVLDWNSTITHFNGGVDSTIFDGNRVTFENWDVRLNTTLIDSKGTDGLQFTTPVLSQDPITFKTKWIDLAGADYNYWKLYDNAAANREIYSEEKLHIKGRNGLATEIENDTLWIEGSGSASDAKITLQAGSGLLEGGDFTLNQNSDKTITFKADTSLLATHHYVNSQGFLTSDSYISNVGLSGTNLTFTGQGSAFNSSVDLSSIVPTIPSLPNEQIAHGDSNNEITSTAGFDFDGERLRLQGSGHANHILIGDKAGYGRVGRYITAIGQHAGIWNGIEESEIERSTFVGLLSGADQSGQDVSFFGQSAGSENTGNNVTGTGYFAARENTGNNVTATGYFAARGNEGENVTGTGYFAAQRNTGANVTGTGYYAAQGNEGDNVTGTGYYAARENTGNNVTGIGHYAAYQNTGENVTATGYFAARGNEGADVTGTGYYAARENTGNNVTGTGYFAAYQNTGENVTGTGYFAARENTGNNVTGTGYYAARENTGNNVTGIGHYAAYQNEGANVTATGYFAARGNTKFWNIAIGHEAMRGNTSYENVILIGNKRSGAHEVAPTANNQVVIGSSVQNHFIQGKLGIKEDTPLADFHNAGTSIFEDDVTFKSVANDNTITKIAGLNSSDELVYRDVGSIGGAAPTLDPQKIVYGNYQQDVGFKFYKDIPYVGANRHVMSLKEDTRSGVPDDSLLVYSLSRAGDRINGVSFNGDSHNEVGFTYENYTLYGKQFNVWALGVDSMQFLGAGNRAVFSGLDVKFRNKIIDSYNSDGSQFATPVLSQDGNGTKWIESGSGGGGGVTDWKYFPSNSSSINLTLNEAGYTNGGFTSCTLNIPYGSSNEKGHSWWVYNRDFGSGVTTTLQVAGGGVINGQSSITLSGNDAVQIVYDGVHWFTVPYK